MKIAFVSIIRETWGGSEELWAAAAKELLRLNNDVYISALHPVQHAPKVQELRNMGARLIVRPGFIPYGLPFNKRVPKKISVMLRNFVSNPYKSLFDEHPDIIVYTGACDSLKHDPYFLKLLYKKKSPLIIINQVHSEYEKTFNEHDAEVLKTAFNYSRKNLFVSKRNKEVMERFLAADIPNAIVVRNPVNLTETGAAPFPENNQVQFAMVANLLINHKGQDLLFDVLRKEPWKSRNWHLNLYGTGVDADYLKRLSHYFHLNDRITFHGRIQDIRKVWCENHILLMPSRLEGMPLAVVEAMLCGRPVVATDVAGHLEWIRDGIDGFIAGGANVFSFGNAMERAWQHRSSWKQMGENACQKALELYDPEPGKTLAAIILDAL